MKIASSVCLATLALCLPANADAIILPPVSYGPAMGFQGGSSISATVPIYMGNTPTITGWVSNSESSNHVGGHFAKWNGCQCPSQCEYRPFPMISASGTASGVSTWINTLIGFSYYFMVTGPDGCCSG